ncbi:MAG TPA: acetyl-coenzyme A synthetase N-terminal domain-containing protein, partial [Magnetospirillaceae bacterium]|nr:acetyl-coenzyme A synthetase N-terminal domain-containing protein [Magnetospirillaceae bacterium]
MTHAEHPDIFPVPAALAKEAQIDAAKYQQWYERSIKDPEGFWGEHGKRIDWIKPYTRVKDSSFDEKDLHIKWFEDGTLNVAANCLDRQLDKRGDKVAILWEGDNPEEQ